jgi:hypothetical protein
MSIADEFKSYTRAVLVQLAAHILRNAAHLIAAAAGPPRLTGRQHTRRLWRKRGRR